MGQFDDFFETPQIPEGPEGQVPRDQWQRPLIVPPPGITPKYTSGKHQGYTPYHRASSFGKQLEDSFHLDAWVSRQVALGVAADPTIAAAVRAIGPTDPWDGTTITAEEKKRRKNALDVQVERAKEASGSNIKSKLGTAIHAATEFVDRGDTLAGFAPLLVERANAYWHFCREHGIYPTSVEVFGVEDENCVAGTWDRTGWFLGKHRILDVKTSSSMDFAGISFPVQLAEYAHASAYDIATHQRTPHAEMDLEEAWIIHVSREQGGPVTLHRVDIRVGWEFAWLVDQVKAAQRRGRDAITDIPDDAAARAILCARSLEELYRIYDASWSSEHRALAAQFAANLRARA